MAKKPAGNARIAPTAHYTAQAWVQAGFPGAERFDTLTGRGLFRALNVLTRLGGRLLPEAIRYHEEHLFIRHAVFESRLRELNPDFVLEIGAGLSPRGIAFATERPALTYVEVDLPGMVIAKQERLAGVRLPPNYHLGTADLLSDRFLESLPVRPEPGQKVVAITEGVTSYLKMNEKRLAWTNIASVLRNAGGGRYVFETYPLERFSTYRREARVFTRALGLIVGRSFDGQLFDTAKDALAMLRECGYASARTLDAEALNPGPWNPPMAHCPWVLLEATLGE